MLHHGRILTVSAGSDTTKLNHAADALSSAARIMGILPSAAGAMYCYLYLGIARLKQGRREEAIEMLSKRNCGLAPAMMAAATNQTEELKVLLSLDINIVVYDSNGYSCLDYAIMSGSTEAEATIDSTKQGKLLKHDAAVKRALREANVVLREEGASSHKKRAALDAKVVPQFTEVFASMMVVSFANFLKFNSMPRSDDGLSENAADLPDTAVIVFFSHRWFRPKDKHPDNKKHGKWRAITDTIRELASAHHVNEQDLYLWVDFHSVDQDAPQKGVNSLPLYIQCSDVFVSLASQEEYWTRAWCLLECLFARNGQEKRQFPRMYQSNDGQHLQPHECFSSAKKRAATEPDGVRNAEVSYETDRKTINFLSLQAKLID